MSAHREAEPTASCWACGARAGPDEALPPLYRCRSCGLGFQPQRTAADVRARHDDAYFSGYGGRGDYLDPDQREHEAQIRVRLVRRHVGGGRLLELGSAAGHFLAASRRAGFETLGIEPATEMAAIARERFGAQILEVALEEADLPPGRFDVACAWHVLEHVPQPLESLQRILRSLRPGGSLLLEVPNADSVRSRRDGPLWGHLDLAHHVAQYTPRSLRALLERAGFQDVELTTVPGAVYRRWPRALASYVKQSVVLRGWPAGEHPAKHELLRGVARAPV